MQKRSERSQDIYFITKCHWSSKNYQSHFLYFTEEIIGDNSALWFSPDGSRIAYVRFNDSLVSELITLDYFVHGFLNIYITQLPWNLPIYL